MGEKLVKNDIKLLKELLEKKRTKLKFKLAEELPKIPEADIEEKVGFLKRGQFEIDHDALEVDKCKMYRDECVCRFLTFPIDEQRKLINKGQEEVYNEISRRIINFISDAAERLYLLGFTKEEALDGINKLDEIETVTEFDFNFDNVFKRKEENNG